jgi:hypothetical protein
VGTGFPKENATNQESGTLSDSLEAESVLDGPKSMAFEAHPSNSAATIVYYAGVSAWSRAQTSRV